MTKVMLFGSSTVGFVPKYISDQLYGLLQQSAGDIEFLVGDKNGADKAFHKELSAIGARSKTNVYYIDSIRNNLFELPTLEFKTEYDSENEKIVIYNSNGGIEKEICDIKKIEDVPFTRDYYTFLDLKMIEDCDMAICIWDGTSKGTFNCISRLQILNKPIYVFRS